MTELEEKLRAVIRAKAEEVPPEAAPPLRLPGRPRHRLLAPAAAAVVVIALIAGSATVAQVLGGHLRGAAHIAGASRTEAAPSGTANVSKAAAWVAAQVSPAAAVSCDPQACRALQRHGFPAGELEVLRGPKSSPLGSDVIVATAAVRRELGGRLTARYAPVVVARFGSGAARVDIRAVAPQGAAAYRSALQADRAARRAAGAQLLHSRRVLVSAAARRQLSAGLVDSRLMITVAALAAGRPLTSSPSAIPAPARPRASRCASPSSPAPGPPAGTARPPSAS